MLPVIATLAVMLPVIETLAVMLAVVATLAVIVSATEVEIALIVLGNATVTVPARVAATAIVGVTEIVIATGDALESAKVAEDVELEPIRRKSEEVATGETEVDARDPGSVILASAGVETKALEVAEALVTSVTNGGSRRQEDGKASITTRLGNAYQDINHLTKQNGNLQLYLGKTSYLLIVV
ncbi:hypothetical protein PF005_g5660 [Phytophthora fragariae]|uniref:Uncharacterized protein n=1 Tax=Phytophthora fragariae TaxID=53985 RepID=A0A6A3FKB1_9STRA|nr:hypothetical protein PF003_g3601 [Phytophthora fragariae]KAE8944797.1 hypothetical protein PF009_g5531 [Phytophthora fragariae]KAE9126189.1 hypothetical protein PF010_g5353 [Phytophthora fragariae]KAE9127111.1 hypothetical protein PF007_g5720 [Phytophthora fragariae]KAE9150137.1 hypothetical protein PF006_g5455 [Phytophthora fragariae]